jgi:predicted RNase H-like HicB family nuclease
LSVNKSDQNDLNTVELHTPRHLEPQRCREIYGRCCPETVGDVVEPQSSVDHEIEMRPDAALPAFRDSTAEWRSRTHGAHISLSGEGQLELSTATIGVRPGGWGYRRTFSLWAISPRLLPFARSRRIRSTTSVGSVDLRPEGFAARRGIRGSSVRSATYRLSLAAEKGPRDPSTSGAAWSPDLPGCAATGETLEQGEREMRAAIALHLEGLARDGDPMPEPSSPGVYLERTTAVALKTAQAQRSKRRRYSSQMRSSCRRAYSSANHSPRAALCRERVVIRSW